MFNNILIEIGVESYPSSEIKKLLFFFKNIIRNKIKLTWNIKKFIFYISQNRLIIFIFNIHHKQHFLFKKLSFFNQNTYYYKNILSTLIRLKNNTTTNYMYILVVNKSIILTVIKKLYKKNETKKLLKILLNNIFFYKTDKKISLDEIFPKFPRPVNYMFITTEKKIIIIHYYTLKTLKNLTITSNKKFTTSMLKNYLHILEQHNITIPNFSKRAELLRRKLYYLSKKNNLYIKNQNNIINETIMNLNYLYVISIKIYKKYLKKLPRELILFGIKQQKHYYTETIHNKISHIVFVVIEINPIKKIHITQQHTNYLNTKYQDIKYLFEKDKTTNLENYYKKIDTYFIKTNFEPIKDELIRLLKISNILLQTTKSNKKKIILAIKLYVTSSLTTLGIEHNDLKEDIIKIHLQKKYNNLYLLTNLIKNYNNFKKKKILCTLHIILHITLKLDIILINISKNTKNKNNPFETNKCVTELCNILSATTFDLNIRNLLHKIKIFYKKSKIKKINEKISTLFTIINKKIINNTKDILLENSRILQQQIKMTKTYGKNSTKIKITKKRLCNIFKKKQKIKNKITKKTLSKNEKHIFKNIFNSKQKLFLYFKKEQTHQIIKITYYTTKQINIFINNYTIYTQSNTIKLNRLAFIHEELELLNIFNTIT